MDVQGCCSGVIEIRMYFTVNFINHISQKVLFLQIPLQLYKDPFNRAGLFNVGFVEALKLNEEFDCFVFTDVDLLPEDDHNYYGCPNSPRHMSVGVDKFNYKYVNIFIILVKFYILIHSCNNRPNSTLGFEPQTSYNYRDVHFTLSLLLFSI